MIRIVMACRNSDLWNNVQKIALKTPDVFVVGQADDCPKALDLVNKMKPEILLLSLDVLNLDPQSVNRLLCSPDVQHTRGVALVSPNRPNDVLRAVRMGCRGAVWKDALAESLIECVTRVNGGETWLDPVATMTLVRHFASAKGAGPTHQTAFDVGDLTNTEKAIVLRMASLARRAQEAEETSNAKSRFFANMSHELRTLLNSIIGFSELVLNGTVGPINEKQREFLRDNLSCSRELRSVINDLLDLAKVEAGKMEVTLETVDPAALIQAEVIDVLRGTAIPKGVTLECEGSVGEVVTDSRKFKHSVYNYVSNAIKFSPPNGRVVVRLERESPEEFSVRVSDEGPGIAEEKIPLLFNRFQQLDAVTAGAGGTGLGLALTKELAELLGGRVGVNSAFGQGSTFYVVLPINGHAKPLRRKAQERDSSRPRVLVVEDENKDRMLLRRSLSRVGYSVDSSSHLQDAVKKCSANRYDAITLDLALGADDGSDLLKEISPLNGKTPVIVVSTARQSLGHCQTRVHAQLRKPIQPSVLFESLRSAGVPPRDQRHDLTVVKEMIRSDHGKLFRLVAASSASERFTKC